MAKIENTTVYPTVTPAASDLLIATDVSDNNKTVTFLVSSISGGGGVAQDLQSVLTTGNLAVEDINLTGGIFVTGTVQPTTITAFNGIGTAGQVLSSTGTGLEWINAGSVSCCSLDDTLTVGNTSSQNIVLSSGQFQANGTGGGVSISAPSTLTNSGISTFTGNVNVNSTDLIFNATGQISAGGSTGTAGQWLISTGTGLAWSSTIPPSNCCPLQSTLNAGNSTTLGITFTGTSTTSFTAGNSITSLGINSWGGQNTFSGPVILSSTVSDGTTIGTAGQVLSSTGSGVSWITPASTTNTLQQVLDTGNSATGANANITISGSFSSGTILDNTGGSGLSGQILQSNGSTYSWVDSACCSLDATLAVGNSSTSSIILSGVGVSLTAPTIIPTNIQVPSGSTGANGEVLGIQGGVLTWVTPGLVDTTYTYDVPNGTTTLRLLDSNASIQDINLTATAPGITITRNSSSQLTFKNTGTTSLFAYPTQVNTAAVTEGCVVTNTAGAASSITLLRYNGGADIGLVPSGGTNTTFLRGDGTWQPAAGGGAVTSVSAAPSYPNSTGSPLVITPTVGAVIATPQRYAGTTNEGFVPRGATGATEYLDGSGNWSIPSGGSGGVTTLALNITNGLTSPLSGSIVGATLTLNSNLFTGMNRVGYVPDSSIYEQDINFLRADGQWAIPAPSTAALNFGIASAQNSTGQSLGVIALPGPITSIVPKIFNGLGNTGFVPTSIAANQTTTFLRADGTWKVPAGGSGGGGAGSYQTSFKFSGQNIDMGAAYYSHSNLTQPSWSATDGNKLTQSSVLTGLNWSEELKFGATVFNNADLSNTGECDETSKVSTLCKAHLTLLGNFSGDPIDYKVELWRWNPCQGYTPLRVATADHVLVGKGFGPICKEFNLELQDMSFSNTQSLFFTVSQNGGGQASLQGRVDLRFTYSAAS